MDERKRNLQPDDAALAVGSPGASKSELLGEIDALRDDLHELRQRTRLKEHYLSVAVHELSTPLTSIKAYVESLSEHYGDPTFVEGRAFLEVLQRETARLIRIVERTLQFSRLTSHKQPLSRKSVDLEIMFGEVCASLKPVLEERGLTLEATTPEDLPAVEADRDLLKQVLINLVDNAAKFSPPGRKISLSTHNVPGRVEIAVKDEGYGISPDELQRVFDPYFRSTDDRVELERGTGLGLAIVKTIVEQHGGRVSVESELDLGTTFRFSMPQA